MIKIISDTTSTISPADAKKLGIYFLPQMIIFGEKSYRDDYEISTEEFLLKLRSSSTLPKTAAPAPALYVPIFEEILKNKDTALVLCPSSKVSGAFNSANTASSDFSDTDIHIIDTQAIGPALGTMVLKAVEWAGQGVAISEIINRIGELSKRVKIYFYVDTLEYLRKGGRIGGAAALAGSVLQIKPILVFKNGQIEQFEKQRTKNMHSRGSLKLFLMSVPLQPIHIYRFLRQMRWPTRWN
jgi:DegV family protein with EDD domain